MTASGLTTKGGNTGIFKPGSGPANNDGPVVEPDGDKVGVPFGGTGTLGVTPAVKAFRDAHAAHDLNLSDEALHHTIGDDPFQAARGSEFRSLSDNYTDLKAATGASAGSAAANYAFANNATYSNQTTPAVISDATARTALTSAFTKKAGFNLVVEVSGTMKQTTAGASRAQMGVRINGVDYLVANNVFNGTGSNDRPSFTGTLPINTLTGLSGSWVVEPVVQWTVASKAGGFDAGLDSISYHVRQVPA